MKHRVTGKKFSRDTNERKALFKSLINSLAINGAIKTTEAKAKVIRRLAEKLVTKARKQTMASRRLVAAFLQNKQAVNRLVNEFGPLFKNQPGGYTRIVKLGNRRGDNAPMARLEFTKKPEPKEKLTKPEKTVEPKLAKKITKTTKKVVKKVVKKDENKSRQAKRN